MIFVTVGNAHNPFRRLVEAADKLADQSDEEFVIQSGHTPYTARHASQVRFLSLDEYDDVMQRARLVVAHAGSGTIISGLSLGKPLIVMPRLKRFGEHVNDHQLEIADELSRDRRVQRVDTADELKTAIAACADAIRPVHQRQPPLIAVLDAWLTRWASGNSCS